MTLGACRDFRPIRLAGCAPFDVISIFYVWFQGYSFCGILYCNTFFLSQSITWTDDGWQPVAAQTGAVVLPGLVYRIR